MMLRHKSNKKEFKIILSTFLLLALLFSFLSITTTSVFAQQAGEIPDEYLVFIEFGEVTNEDVDYITGEGAWIVVGTEVFIKANAAEEDMVFDMWTSEEEVTFADASNPETSFTMPAEDVTITANYAHIYDINVESDGNGTASADKETAKAGDIITLTATADDGYEFDEWVVTSEHVEPITIKDNKFTMPDEAVTVKAFFAKLPVYSITEGADATWEGGTSGDLTIVCDGAFSDFIGLEIDGEEVPPSDYTATEGSTIIKLKAAYLEKLSEGEHTLEILFEKGSVKTQFTVFAAKAALEPKAESETEAEVKADSTTAEKDDKNEIPKTGETGTSIYFAYMLLLAAALLGSLRVYAKKHRSK